MTPALEYGSPAHIFAYVYYYMATRAEAVFRFIIDVGKEANVFHMHSHAPVICSIGGGPGSDLLGFGLAAHCCTRNFQYIHLDSNPAWGPALCATTTEVNRFYRPDLVESREFHFDLCDACTWNALDACRTADLFTFIYCLSDASKDPNRSCWDGVKKVFEIAKPGATFLFMEPHDSDYHREYDATATQCSIRQLGAEEEWPFKVRLGQKSWLGVYLDIFGELNLRINPRWRIGRK